MFLAKFTGPPHARHLGAQICEDAAGGTGQTTSSLQAQSCEDVPGGARMSQAKRAGPPHGQHLRAQSCQDVSGTIGWRTSRAAFASPEWGGCLRRNWLHHRRSGHLGAQSCEDVPGERGRTTSCNGIPQPRVARMSLARRAVPPQIRASLSAELRRCLWRIETDHLARGISEPRVSRMSQANLARRPRAQHI